MTEIKLKPCPFCGGEAKMFVVNLDIHYHGWHAYCTKCDAKGGGSDISEEVAAERWNGRKYDTESADEILKEIQILEDLDNIENEWGEGRLSAFNDVRELIRDMCEDNEWQ